MNKPSPIYGNFEDKYSTTNPVSKFLVKGFLNTFHHFLETISEQKNIDICEVGCAEGELLKHIHLFFPTARLLATDISENEIEKARKNCQSIPVEFSIQNAENLAEFKDGEFDLVICCEVLEHLDNPTQGLRELHRISKKNVLVSVPNEPIWRILNMVRGKYIKTLGNTPGHLNHWTVLQFPKFLQNGNFKIISKKYPLPWQMILLEKTTP